MCILSIIPLTTKSDQHMISPNNIINESNIKVRWIKQIITNKRSFLLLNKFSLLASKEMLGEYAYWC